MFTGPKVYRYHWLHVPSGRRGIKEQSFETATQFKNALDRWNSAYGGKWKYWAAD